MKPGSLNTYLLLEAFNHETHELNVIVETPKGSRNKFEYDYQLGLFKLGGVLPAGSNFPFDFGFVPSTLGEDGDPLDVLLLMDEPAFTGCLVPARLIGVVEAEQTERDGETVRNDRLIAVAAKSLAHRNLKSLEQLLDLEKVGANSSVVKENSSHADFKSGDAGPEASQGRNILLEEIEHFFISYNTFKGKEFKPLGRFGPDRAQRLVEEGAKRFRSR